MDIQLIHAIPMHMDFTFIYHDCAEETKLWAKPPAKIKFMDIYPLGKFSFNGS